MKVKTKSRKSCELTAQKPQESLRHSFSVCATRLTVKNDALPVASQVTLTCSGEKP